MQRWIIPLGVVAVLAIWGVSGRAEPAPNVKNAAPTATAPAAPAQAAPANAAPSSPLAATFGNTVKITTAAGVTLVYFNPDGTFSSTGPDGDDYGTWKIKGEDICTVAPGAAESCGVVEPNRSVGSQWQNKLNGEMVTIEIVEGR